jgi:hypothetical protein
MRRLVNEEKASAGRLALNTTLYEPRRGLSEVEELGRRYLGRSQLALTSDIPGPVDIIDFRNFGIWRCTPTDDIQTLGTLKEQC